MHQKLKIIICFINYPRDWFNHWMLWCPSGRTLGYTDSISGWPTRFATITHQKDVVRSLLLNNMNRCCWPVLVSQQPNTEKINIKTWSVVVCLEGLHWMFIDQEFFLVPAIFISSVLQMLEVALNVQRKWRRKMRHKNWDIGFDQ